MSGLKLDETEERKKLLFEYEDRIEYELIK